MSYLKATWLRPAAGVLVVLAVAALWLMGANATEAGNDGNVVITPASATVGAGGTTTVSVDITAPDGGLSVWIIEIGYDPDVVELNTINSNFDCQSMNVADPGGAGTLVQANGCAAKDTSNPADGKLDTAVTFGAWVKNVTGAATGWTGTHTVATFTFKAVGVAGESSPLTVNVGSGNFLRPDGNSVTPSHVNGLITISAGTTRVFGDVDCSGGSSPVDIGDAINATRATVHLPVNAASGCPTIGNNVSINGTQRAWADVDCSGGSSPVDIGDAINIQRAIVHLPVNAASGCPDIGDQVTVG